MSNTAENFRLSLEQKNQFERDGFLILENLLDASYKNRLISEMDTLMEDRETATKSPERPRPLTAYPEMGLLTSHPPIMEMLEELLGPLFAMHHIHSTRHDSGYPGVGWHQDYEQDPHTNRSHIMVHVFYYLNGLNGEIGDLLVLPGSQKIVVQRSLEIFGTEDLPGSICVDRLPPGSAVIVHSAVWHARRPKPGGNNQGRYFIDISYCQHGVLWPAYGSVEEVNRTAVTRGLDRRGRYRHVYDSTQFFDREQLNEQTKQGYEGSLLLELKNKNRVRSNL